MSSKDSSHVIVLPRWQVMQVLVGIPLLYIANSLLPWSIGLFHRHEHAFFFQFWGSIALLHWASVAFVLSLLRRGGWHLTDIGLNFSLARVSVMIGIPLVIGLTLIGLHQTSSGNHTSPSPVLPATIGERLFWIFISLTAGFCEELIYRGFSIRALQGRNMRTWLAVALATLAFFFMHGVWALALPSFLIISIAGLLFSALFLWRQSLVPGICLHALIDMTNIA